MRRFLKNAFCKAEPRSGSAAICTAVRKVTCLATIGGVLAISQASAKDPVKPETQSNKLVPAHAAAQGGATVIPEYLEKLKLSQQQETQTKEIIRSYDVKLDAVWKQFGEKYMETVRTEVSLLAAVEDSLTESQRKTVREQRRKVAHAEMAMEGTNTKPNRATEKPADPVDQAATGVGISLTTDQESMADKIQEKYAGHLRSLNRDIQGIHNRLVSLDADKLVEIEKLLTKEQLVLLRADRQKTTAEQKVTATDNASKKAE